MTHTPIMAQDYNLMLCLLHSATVQCVYVCVCVCVWVWVCVCVAQMLAAGLCSPTDSH